MWPLRQGAKKSLEMSEEAKYLQYLDVQLPLEIEVAAAECLSDTIDPEVAWAEFRKVLKVIKKEHVERYLKYMETDDDDEIISEKKQ